MRAITDVRIEKGYQLRVVFDDGKRKYFDMESYLDYPAFQVLKSPMAFEDFRNGKFFVEWPAYELDLSADTLWHEGTDSIIV